MAAGGGPSARDRSHPTPKGPPNLAGEGRGRRVGEGAVAIVGDGAALRARGVERVEGRGVAIDVAGIAEQIVGDLLDGEPVWLDAQAES